LLADSAVALSGQKVYTIDKEEYRVMATPNRLTKEAIASLLGRSATAFLYDEDKQ
jgi:hypothetical protein